MTTEKPETVAVGSDGLISQFVAAVTNELHKAGWTVRDDGNPGLPDKIMDTEIARAITKYANILTTDEWKAHRIAMCKSELSALANSQMFLSVHNKAMSHELVRPHNFDRAG